MVLFVVFFLRCFFGTSISKISLLLYLLKEIKCIEGEPVRNQEFCYASLRDAVTHTRKMGKTHPCQHEYTSQNPQDRYDYCNRHSFCSSGLFHLGNWFKLYQWRNAIFHRSTLRSQAATYFGRCPG